MYLVLVHDRRLTECWSQLGASLRTAQAIGLHRDGAKLGLEWVSILLLQKGRFFGGRSLMIDAALFRLNIVVVCGRTSTMLIGCEFLTALTDR